MILTINNMNKNLSAARLFREGHRWLTGFPFLATHILSTASTVTHGRTKVSAEITCKIPRRSVQDGVNLDCEAGVVNR